MQLVQCAAKRATSASGKLPPGPCPKKLMTLEKNVQEFSGSLIPALYDYM